MKSRTDHSEVTVGIDIGTTSVKAIAAEGDGTILRRCRVRHALVAPTPDVFEHDAAGVWRDGVLEAWQQVASGFDVAAVTVSAMVPSLCGVDASGTPVTPGLLYGDARGRTAGGRDVTGEMVGFAAALASMPGVVALLPAQAVANLALGGVAAIDTGTAMTAAPLFDGSEWDAELCAEIGITTEQLPAIGRGPEAVGEVDGALLSGGLVDAAAEQMVADAGDPGDVLVVCGTTLITWAITDERREVDGLWTVPYNVPGHVGIGGASNAGGLFLDRVRSLVGAVGDRDIADLDPADLPVWLPYIRGERTPLHDPHRRSELLDLNVGHDRAHVLRAAYEAAGFVVRHHLERAATNARRIVATGGGTRSVDWMQALADTTGLPVDVAAAPEGAALGAAFNSRLTAGLTTDLASGRGWSPTGHRVEPRGVWTEASEPRYHRFLEATNRPRLKPSRSPTTKP